MLAVAASKTRGFFVFGVGLDVGMSCISAIKTFLHENDNRVLFECHRLLQMTSIVTNCIDDLVANGNIAIPIITSRSLPFALDSR